MALSLFVCVSLCVGVVFSRSNGPPAVTSVCVNLIPDSSSPHSVVEGNGTYDLTIDGLTSSGSYFSYTAGQQYTGTISAGAGVAIRGFLVQAWNPANERIGSFTAGAGQQLLDCSGFNSILASATLSHNAINTNPTVTFTWTAPSGANGLVDFRYTIVRSRPMFFGPLSAASPDGSIQVATVAPTDSETASTNELTESPNNQNSTAGTESPNNLNSTAGTESPNNLNITGGSESINNSNTTAGAMGFSASLLLCFFVAIVIIDMNV